MAKTSTRIGVINAPPPTQGLASLVLLALFQRLRGGGLVVAAIDPDSRALQAGFRPGDIIYAVNRRRIQTTAEFQKLLSTAERGYAVSLLRGDFSVTIIVR